MPTPAPSCFLAQTHIHTSSHRYKPSPNSADTRAGAEAPTLPSARSNSCFVRSLFHGLLPLTPQSSPPPVLGPQAGVRPTPQLRPARRRCGWRRGHRWRRARRRRCRRCAGARRRSIPWSGSVSVHACVRKRMHVSISSRVRARSPQILRTCLGGGGLLVDVRHVHLGQVGEQRLEPVGVWGCVGMCGGCGWEEGRLQTWAGEGNCETTGGRQPAARMVMGPPACQNEMLLHLAQHISQVRKAQQTPSHSSPCPTSGPNPVSCMRLLTPSTFVSCPASLLSLVWRNNSHPPTHPRTHPPTRPPARIHPPTHPATHPRTHAPTHPPTQPLTGVRCLPLCGSPAPGTGCWPTRPPVPAGRC